MKSVHHKRAKMNHPRQLLCIGTLLSLYGKVSTFTGCQKSILTVRHVPCCPKDEASWREAARKMNCESVTQNCASKSHNFQYHCLINPYMNATVEVCALNQTIFGYCAEFDINCALVQENYSAHCKTHNPPCPKYYDSAKAYRYQSCYALVQRKSRTRKYAPRAAAVLGSSSSANGLDCCNGYMFSKAQNRCVECPSGFYGLQCNESCPFPTYGVLCRLRCTCEIHQCNNINGCSIGTSTEVQEVHQTTHLYNLTSPVINTSILYNGLNVSMRTDHFQNLSK